MSMSNNTEALKLALEALLPMAKACSACVDGPEDEHCCRLAQWNAIKAIDGELKLAALAQAEQPGPGANAKAHADRICAQAEQAQPVALTDARRWIPVTEKCPDYDEADEVLAFTRDHNYGGVQFHQMKALDFYEYDPDGDGEPGTDLARTVTHWMPLPWPPADELAAPPAAPQPVARVLREGEVMGAYMDFDRTASREWSSAEYLTRFGLFISERTAATPQPQAAQQAVAWQPIETAPTGDDDLLHAIVAYPLESGAYFVEEAWWDSQRREWWPANTDHGDAVGEPIYPTHWMPMPAAPGAAAPTQAAPLVALTQAAQARDDAIWYDIRATLRAVIEDGHSADLDEVDAKRLLDLIDAAPPPAAPLTDADIEAVMGPCQGSEFAEHLRREFIKSFKRVYFKLHPERAHGIHAQEGATKPSDWSPADRGELAGDGKPCPNKHDPDCRWPQCMCRAQWVGAQEGAE